MTINRVAIAGFAGKDAWSRPAPKGKSRSIQKAFMVFEKGENASLQMSNEELRELSQWPERSYCHVRPGR